MSNNELSLADKMAAAYQSAVRKSISWLNGENPNNIGYGHDAQETTGHLIRNKGNSILNPQDIQILQNILYNGGVQQW